MRAIIIKDEPINEVLKEFPTDYIFQVGNILPPRSARVTTIPTDDVRACAGVIAGEMAKRNINEYVFFDEAMRPYVDMSRKIIQINHNQGLNYKVLFDNFFANLPFILRSPGVKADQFKGIPALIVSAGPSLNKNIHLFPEAKGKCLTITSGSAIGALQARGWEPDAACLVDPFSLAVVDFKAGDYRLVANYTSNPNAALMTDHHSYFQTIGFNAPMPLPQTEQIQVDISVATTAYNLAVLWGCDPIIFIGQDCGMSDGERYADGICQDSLDGYTDKQEPQYAMLADYFRMVFANSPATVYNCTEGGKNLGEYAIHCKLEDALSRLSQRPEIAWEELSAVKPVAGELKAQAKEIMNSYRQAKLFDRSANTVEKIERFLLQQRGTIAWKWLNKLITPIMYECEGEYPRWYIALLTWQEWCLKLANKLEEVAKDESGGIC